LAQKRRNGLNPELSEVVFGALSIKPWRSGMGAVDSAFVDAELAALLGAKDAAILDPELARVAGPTNPPVLNPEPAALAGSQDIALFNPIAGVHLRRLRGCNSILKPCQFEP